MFNRIAGYVVIAVAFGSLLSAQVVDHPMTAGERVRWLVHQNLGPVELAEDVAAGAEGTLSNTPKEYGPHWDGFAKRVGIVTANYGVKTVMEAGLGSLWGEDPRYQRTEGAAFSSRLGHVFKMTFFARDRAGHEVPAYARLMAVPGSNFLANTWMPDSEAHASDALLRTGLGFLSRMGENAYKEFKSRK
jgi:hypothetical protein